MPDNPTNYPPPRYRLTDAHPGMARSEDWRADLDPVALLAIGRRYLPLVATCLAGALMLGGAYLALAPKTYTGSARLIIDPNRGVPAALRRTDTLQEKAFIDTQIEILTSRELATTVAREENLVDDPELTSNGLIASLVAHLRPTAPITDPASLATLRLTERTRVTRSGATYLVDVTYRSGERGKAARVANALVRAYLEEQQAAIRAETIQSAENLDHDVLRLNTEALAAERAAIEYRVRNGIQAGATEDSSGQQMVDLDQRWTAARDAARLATDRLALIQAARSGEPADVSRAVRTGLPNTGTLARFAQAVADADAAQQRAPDPGAAETSRTTLAARQALKDEVARMIAALQDIASVAQDHEATLRRDLDEAAARLSQQQNQLVEYRTLESRARTLRTLADERLRVQAELRSQGGSRIPAAVFASEAITPLYPSSPKPLAVLALSGILGLGIGGGAGLLRHITDRRLRSRADVRKATGLPLIGILPRLRSRKARLPDQDTLRRGPFAQGLREIRVGTALHHGDATAQTVGILSARRGEGRTTLAINLARSIALTGEKALLIDLDTQNSDISRTLASSDPAGSSPAGASLSPRFDEAFGCDVLPLAAAMDLNTGNLAALKKTIEGLEKSYDTIVIDLPACTASMEVSALATAIRSFILVVAAGRTPREAIAEALDADPTVASRILGVVLN